jgi:hypothetical protein
MHLLYLDDSGSPKNSSEEYYVLGGVSIFESQAGFLTKQLNDLAETIQPKDPFNLEFHASEIFNGHTEPWKSMSREERRGVIKSILKIFANSYDSSRVFACAVHKASFPGQDPVKLSFEDQCTRFDLLLERIKQSGDNVVPGKRTHHNNISSIFSTDVENFQGKLSINRQ